jgi:acetyltransferase-like isoleucine patch superfamily enzyme
MNIKSVIKKILGYKKRTYSSVENFINSGNLIHGENCNLQGMTVSITHSRKDFVNIKIGNDCSLSCNILLQSENSQIIIGDGVFIGPGTTLFCYDKITFEDDIMVSWGCTFIDTNAHSLKSEERLSDVRDWLKGAKNKKWSVVKHSPILIKSKCWIGFNTIVAKAVCLEEGTVIGCGSVVIKSTERYSVYGGNPAEFIKKTS